MIPVGLHCGVAVEPVAVAVAVAVRGDEDEEN